MKTEIMRSFARDVRAVRDKPLLKRLNDILIGISKAGRLSDLTGVAPMSGHPGYYRPRVGDHRIGFFMNDDVVMITRFLHRREIYRHFP